MLPEGADAMFDPLEPGDNSQRAELASNDGWEPLPAPPHAKPYFRHVSLGEPSKVWKYLNAAGEPEGYICRFETVNPDGSTDKEFRPYRYGCLTNKAGRRRLGWHWKGWLNERPLYRLPDLLAHRDEPVIVCEGEKKADAARQLFAGWEATTPMNGAKSPAKTDWTPLRGRQVAIWPDHDAAGAAFAEEVASLLHIANAASIAIVDVPEHWPQKWDLADPVPDGASADTLALLLAQARCWSPPSQSSYASFGPYRMTPGGLLFDTREDDEPPALLSSPFEVLASTRDARSAEWGLLLRWRDPDGHEHLWAMPKALLGGRTDELWKTLLRNGLEIAASVSRRNRLAEYLGQVRVEARARCVARIGWHPSGPASVFVLPDTVFGNTGGDNVLLQTEKQGDSLFNVAGSVDDWREQVASRCVGNSRLVLAVCAAFAAPLLYVAAEENGGFHFVGASRSGKTTALRVAGSVWGGGGINGYLRQWRATANGLEGIAEAHSDALLCLDEMGQVDGREAGGIAYMLANGQGKGRAGRDGGTRSVAQWRVLLLSTGEIGLTEKMTEAGHRVRAGQEVRLADIPADAGVGMGMFEDLHGIAAPGAFAEMLRDAALCCYGTPIRAFLDQLARRWAEDRDGLARLLEENRARFLGEVLPNGVSGQVRSVCGRFALVAAAGSIATAFGLTGWLDDEADRAAATCFRAWLDRRGSSGDREMEVGIDQVIRFLEANGASRFQTLGDEGSGEKVINRAGFRKRVNDGRWQYMVLPKVWKAEVAKDFDSVALAKALALRRMLLTSSEGKNQRPVKVPSEGTLKLYVFAPGILGEPGEEGDASE